MITHYDLIVIYKKGLNDLKSKAYKFGSENCPFESGKLVLDYVIERAKGEGLIPVCVMYLPYLAISKDMIKRLIFEADVLNMKCLWIAEGYSLDNIIPLHKDITC